MDVVVLRTASARVVVRPSGTEPKLKAYVEVVQELGARDLDHAKEIKTKLEGSSVDVKVRAGEGGRLFGAVTVNDIADAISGSVGESSVDKRKILVGNPIKSLGTHQVTVKLHDEVNAVVDLNVVPA